MGQLIRSTETPKGAAPLGGLGQGFGPGSGFVCGGDLLCCEFQIRCVPFLLFCLFVFVLCLFMVLFMYDVNLPNKSPPKFPEQVDE